MRKYLFRGKHLDTHMWLYGSLITTNGPCAISQYDGAVRSVDPYSVGEYTGFDDVNGTHIFEGDRVSLIHSEMAWEVLWIDGCWVLHLVNGGCSPNDYQRLNRTVSCVVIDYEEK